MNTTQVVIDQCKQQQRMKTAEFPKGRDGEQRQEAIGHASGRIIVLMNEDIGMASDEMIDISQINK